MIEEVNVVVMTVEGRKKEERKRRRNGMVKIAAVLVHVVVLSGVHAVVLKGVHAVVLKGVHAVQGGHAVVLHEVRLHVAPLQPRKNSQWTARKVEV